MWFLFFVGYLLLSYLVGFFVWKGVRDEYDNDSIVILIMGSSLGVWFMGKVMVLLGLLFQGVFDWGMLLSVPIDYLAGVWGGYATLSFLNYYLGRKKWSDVLDYWWTGLLIGSLVYISSYVFSSQDRFWALIALLLVIAGYLFHLFILSRYRRFVWYPSGKVGFSFWMGMIVFSIVYAVWSIYWYAGFVQWFKLFMAIISLGWSVVCLYVLSGRKWKHDFPWVIGFVDRV